MKHLFALLFTALTFTIQAQSKLNFTFSSFEDAAQYIMDDDRFNRGLSKFDIHVRMNDPYASKAELKALQHAQCKAWTAAETALVKKAIAALEQSLNSKGFNLPMPKEVLLIKTTMAEELNAAAYTRENQIYLGQKVLRSPELSTLLAHELFHVLTRKNPAFKAEMYKAIGFTCLDHEIKFPKDLWDMRISNPDISAYDSYATFTIQGKKQNCTMFLYASAPYEEDTKLSDYLKVGLVPLDEEFQPLVADGKTVVYSVEDAEDFYDVVGRNTSYVINPEECMADNFAIAVMGQKPGQELPNPAIIEQICSVLQAL